MYSNCCTCILIFVYLFLLLCMYSYFCVCIPIVVYVFLLLCMYSYCCVCILIVVYVFLFLCMYSYRCLCVVYVFLDAATLTEVFPCFFLSCKANARANLGKTGHGLHSPKLLCCSKYCLFCVVLCTVCV